MRLFRIIRRKLNPTDYEKVMKNVKRSIVNKNLPKGSSLSSKEDEDLK